ncbi:MAG: hypothetical protein IJM20_07110 [Clostridia bacterium]|nr:hypothetical protein [Clostridia bacterium]
MKKLKKTEIILLAALMLATALISAACSKDEEEEQDPMNPVVLKIGEFELKKFYFDSLYATHEKYYYLSAGAITQEEYFNTVVDAVEDYAVTLKEARDRNFTVTAEEEETIKNDTEAQWQYIREEFLRRVDSSITEEDQIEAEFARLFEVDTGYTPEAYREYLAESMHDRILIKKLYDSVTEEVEPTDEEVRSYLDLKVNSLSQETFAAFADKYAAYRDGSGEPFIFIPADCFAVDQLLLEGDGAAALAEQIDARFEGGISFDQFIMLVSGDSNADENMRNEKFRSLGYLMHASTVPSYPQELAYGAYAASGSKIYPGMSPEYSPEYTVLKTSDGKTVVKVAAAGSIRYVTVVKTYIKGNVSYHQGDDIWNMGYEGAKAQVGKTYFDGKVAEWRKAAKIEWFFDRFKSNYVPAESKN